MFHDYYISGLLNDSSRRLSQPGSPIFRRLTPPSRARGPAARSLPRARAPLAGPPSRLASATFRVSWSDAERRGYDLREVIAWRIIFEVCWAGLLLLAGSAAALASCRGRDSASGDKPSGTRTRRWRPMRAAIVTALKARRGSPLAAGAADRFDAVPGGLKPRFAASDVAAEPAPARVTLPRRRTAPLHLEDAATSVAVDVSLSGATAVAAQTGRRLRRLPGRARVGRDRLAPRARRTGREDFVAFDAKPAPRREIAYDLALGQGAAGLRLVGGTLEVLDAGGAPRLRVAPPYIVGADGARTDATLAVDGLRGRHQPGAAVGAGGDRARRARPAGQA